MAFYQPSGYSAQNIKRRDEINDVTTRNNRGGTFVGRYTGIANDAENTTSIGYQSFSSNFGNDNTGLGYDTGVVNTSGYSNTFIGSKAGNANTIGFNNINLGAESAQNNTSGSFNLIIGNEAGKYQNNNFNIILGNQNINQQSDYIEHSINIGNKNRQYGEYNNVIGNENSNMGDKNLILGNQNKNESTNSILLGNNIENKAQNSIIFNTTKSNLLFEEEDLDNTIIFNNLIKLSPLSNIIKSKQIYLLSSNSELILNEDNLIFNGETSINGNTNVNGVLTTDTLNATTVRFGSNLSIVGKLNVGGAATMEDNLSINSNLNVNNSTILKGTLNVNSNSKFNGIENDNMTILNDTLIAHSIKTKYESYFDENVSFSKTIFNQDSIISSNLNTSLLSSSNIQNESKIYTNDIDTYYLTSIDLNCLDHLECSGMTTLCNVVINENLNVKSNIYLFGNLSNNSSIITKDINTDSLNVKTSLDVDNKFTVEKNILCEIDCIMNSNLNVIDSLTVSNNTNLENLYINGETVHNSSSLFKNDAFFRTNVNAENIKINNNLIVQSNITINDFLIVNDVNVKNNLIVNSNIFTNNLYTSNNHYIDESLYIEKSIISQSFSLTPSNISFNVPCNNSNDVIFLKNVTINSNIDNNFTSFVNFLCYEDIFTQKNLYCSNDILGEKDINIKNNIYTCNDIYVKNKTESKDLISKTLNINSNEILFDNNYANFNLITEFNSNIVCNKDAYFNEKIILSNNELIAYKGLTSGELSLFSNVSMNEIVSDKIQGLNIFSENLFSSNLNSIYINNAHTLISSNGLFNNLSSINLNNIQFIESSNINTVELFSKNIDSETLNVINSSNVNIFTSNLNSINSYSENLESLFFVNDESIINANLTALQGNFSNIYSESIETSLFNSEKITINDSGINGDFAQIMIMSNVYFNTEELFSTNINSKDIISSNGNFEKLYISDELFSNRLISSNIEITRANINVLDVNENVIANQISSCNINIDNKLQVDKRLIAKNMTACNINSSNINVINEITSSFIGSCNIRVPQTLSAYDLTITNTIIMGPESSVNFGNTAAFDSSTFNTLTCSTKCYLPNKFQKLILDSETNDIYIQTDKWFTIPIFTNLETHGTFGFNVNKTNSYYKSNIKGIYLIDVSLYSSKNIFEGEIVICKKDQTNTIVTDTNILYRKYAGGKENAKSTIFMCYINQDEEFFIAAKCNDDFVTSNSKTLPFTEEDALNIDKSYININLVNALK